MASGRTPVVYKIQSVRLLASGGTEKDNQKDAGFDP
jgi:hypothetical protein